MSRNGRNEKQKILIVAPQEKNLEELRGIISESYSYVLVSEHKEAIALLEDYSNRFDAGVFYIDTAESLLKEIRNLFARVNQAHGAIIDQILSRIQVYDNPILVFSKLISYRSHKNRLSAASYALYQICLTYRVISRKGADDHFLIFIS